MQATSAEPARRANIRCSADLDPSKRRRRSAGRVGSQRASLRSRRRRRAAEDRKRRVEPGGNAGTHALRAQQAPKANCGGKIAWRNRPDTMTTWSRLPWGYRSPSPQVASRAAVRPGLAALPPSEPVPLLARPDRDLGGPGRDHPAGEGRGAARQGSLGRVAGHHRRGRVDPQSSCSRPSAPSRTTPRRVGDAASRTSSSAPCSTSCSPVAIASSQSYLSPHRPVHELRAGPFQGYMPDLVPAHQVGRASGFIGLMIVFGRRRHLHRVDRCARLSGGDAGLRAAVLADHRARHPRARDCWNDDSRCVSNGLAGSSRGGRSWLSVATSAWGRDVLRQVPKLRLARRIATVLPRTGSTPSIRRPARGPPMPSAWCSSSSRRCCCGRWTRHRATDRRRLDGRCRALLAFHLTRVSKETRSMVRTPAGEARRRSPAAAVLPARPIVRDFSGGATASAVTFDARTAYDFLISLMIGSGEDTDLLPEDAEWRRRTRAALPNGGGGRPRRLFRRARPRASSTACRRSSSTTPRCRDAADWSALCRAATGDSDSCGTWRPSCVAARRSTPSWTVRSAATPRRSTSCHRCSRSTTARSSLEILADGPSHPAGPGVDLRLAAVSGRSRAASPSIIQRDIRAAADRASLDPSSLIERTTGRPALAAGIDRPRGDHGAVVLRPALQLHLLRQRLADVLLPGRRRGARRDRWLDAAAGRHPPLPGARRRDPDAHPEAADRPRPLPHGAGDPARAVQADHEAPPRAAAGRRARDRHRRGHPHLLQPATRATHGGGRRADALPELAGDPAVSTGTAICSERELDE